MKRVNKKLAASIILLSQTLTGAAFAASVTLSGTTIDFTFDDAMLGMFGTANVSGDTLYFTPTDFVSQSSNGAGYVLTNETINVQVTAHEGYSFSDFDFVEKGDYLRQGRGSSVNAAGQVRLFDVADPLVEITSSLVAAPVRQSGASTHNWLAETSADLSAWNTASTINVTIENLLLASTRAPNSLAFVEKKFVGMSFVTTPVPEAETYAMMLAGLGLIGFVVRRRAA
ncbi:MAG: PEP-CTERM sorting domain-containing protein [Saprospiraceae bacterium]|nr:PEP-CTERM sorting domain-containing protein [Saprospiraceae bacterium]